MRFCAGAFTSKRQPTLAKERARHNETSNQCLLLHLWVLLRIYPFPYVSIIFLGKFFISSPPTQTCCNSALLHKPLQVRWRKFLSIFLILLLWSHDFVVAEVCFRSLSSWMMKFLVRIFCSGTLKDRAVLAVIRSSFPTPTPVKVPVAKQTFQLKSEDAFLLMMLDTRQRSHTSKKK